MKEYERKFQIPVLPARTKALVKLNVTTGEYEIEKYECLDCGFTTKSPDLMLVHQDDHKAERAAKRFQWWR